MAVQSSAVDIHLRSSQALGLQSTSSFSVLVWINVSAWGAVGSPVGRRSYVGIYGPPTDVPLGDPNTAVQIGTSTGTGELSFWTWGGGLVVGTGTNFMTAFNNQWVNLGYTYDGVTHRGYLNGSQVATSTVTPITGFLNQVYINGYPGGLTAETAAFQIDQYYLFRRTLQPAEIQTIAACRGARHGITDDIICRFEFGELAQGASVSNVRDLSGGISSLTPVGAGAPMTYTYPGVVPTSNLRPVQ